MAKGKAGSPYFNDQSPSALTVQNGNRSPTGHPQCLQPFFYIDRQLNVRHLVIISYPSVTEVHTHTSYRFTFEVAGNLRNS